MFSLLLISFNHRGLFQLLAAHPAEGREDRFIVLPLRVPQDGEGLVLLEDNWVDQRPELFRRDIVEDPVIQHPASEVAAHRRIAKPCVQKPGFKRPHLLQSLFRRTNPNPV